MLNIVQKITKNRTNAIRLSLGVLLTILAYFGSIEAGSIIAMGSDIDAQATVKDLHLTAAATLLMVVSFVAVVQAISCFACVAFKRPA